MTVYPYKKQNAQHIADLFFKKCTEGGKKNNVYGMITSNRLGEFVRQHLMTNGISVMYYHGENGKIELIDGVQMLQ
jgi:hypothetical protein